MGMTEDEFLAQAVTHIFHIKLSLLRAYLEPMAELKAFELNGDNTSVLAVNEDLKTLPWGAVWNMLCARDGKPTGREWLEDCKRYEADVTIKR